MRLTVNEERLMKNIFQMAEFGMNERGGIDRTLGSQADYDTRKWLETYWKEHLGLKTRTDPAANLWSERPGTKDLLPLVMGSHHDAVPDGGKYDGAMGVLIATELMETIIEKNISLRHPFWLISFTGEEPNPFNLSTLGSKVISGRLKAEDLKKSKNRETGEALEDALKRLGGDIGQLNKARILPGNIRAFIEVHNELGRNLDSRNLSVSGVSCITGIYREEITVEGEANHAGTTMMQDRKDAMAALCEVVLIIEKAAREYHNPNVVATVGYAKLVPNEANIIPGEAKAIADIRTCNKEIQNELINKITEAVKKVEQNRRVKIKRKVLLDQMPQKLNSVVMQAIREGITHIKEPDIEIPSMAGHDAANMGLITMAGMIFVRSVGGKGHCRQEFSRKEDIAKAANAALYALLKLDKELD